MKLPADVALLLAKRFANQHRDWLAATTPEQQQRHWPQAIALGLPTEQAALRQVEAVRAWAEAWRAWRGPGELRWTERRWKVLGTQSLPESLTLHGPAQAAMWSGEHERWQRAAARFQQMTARWPALAGRLPRLFGVLADYADADFQRLLDLLAWLLAHPRSGLYPRQLPLAGIDSKWMEQRRGVLVDLLATLRASPQAPDGPGGTDGPDQDAGFYALSGLRRPPVQLRMRVLDARLRARLGGLGDVTAPVEELARLDLPASVVLIVENLQTGLALADLPGTVAFMALGYSVDLLAQLPWIAPARCLYWGDIDTHGYAILQRARGHLPALRSLLMDQATLLRFAPLWSDEKVQHGADELAALTAEEGQVYRGLKQQQWRPNLRLEQERIDWDFAWAALLAAVERRQLPG